MTTITIEAAIQDLQEWLSGNRGCQLRCEAILSPEDPNYIVYVAELTTVNEHKGIDDQIEEGIEETLADALTALTSALSGYQHEAPKPLLYDYDGAPI